MDSATLEGCATGDRTVSRPNSLKPSDVDLDVFETVTLPLGSAQPSCLQALAFAHMTGFQPFAWAALVNNYFLSRFHHLKDCHVQPQHSD
jgi:hypothetical protein